MNENAAAVSGFCDDALAMHDAVALANLLAKKTLSSTELVEAAIARAERVNQQINAIAVPDFERARAKARQAQSGPLAGVPSFIKDTDEVEGLPLYFGSRAVSGQVSRESSAMVKQIEATGLLSLGTSTTPEFGLAGTTESERFGATKNPWNLAYSSGGSSGGSAALVASGVVPIAHANDGAGSIRIPAACCGLVGLKPSRGRLPAKPVPGYLPPNIFHEGVLSRSVRDTAAFYAAVEQQQGSEGLKPIGELQGPPAKRLKIALLAENCRGVDCDSQLLKAAHGAGALCEGLGHHVELISNPFYAGFDDDFWLLWSHMAFAVRYASKIVVKQTLESDKLQAWAKYLVSYHWKNLHRVPAAFRRLSRFVGQYQQFMANYDVLLSPTLGAPTPKLGYFGPAVPGRIHMDRKYPFIPFTKYQNISGAPAISLPMGVCASGLPLGIQFAAGLGEERTLLALALELEQAQPWQSLASPATAVQP